MRLARALLVLGAVVAGGFGLVYTIRPEWLAGLVDIALPTAAARADFRATYGGAQLGIAAFCALAAARPPWYRPALLALGLTVGGFGVVRLSSLALDGVFPRLLLAVGVIELAGAFLCLVAFRQLDRSA